MDCELKKVKANKLLSIRAEVLRNNTEIKNCNFPGDNDDESIHIGAYKNNNLIGGVSLFKEKTEHKNLKKSYQLRGMCVLGIYQNKGLGKKMLDKIEKLCMLQGGLNIWMNSRKKAVNFYLKSNYIDSGISYEIEGIGVHNFLYKRLK